MSVLLSINWIPFLALAIVLLAFALIHFLETRINWTLLMLLSLGLGAAIGVVFASKDNLYLTWVDMLGNIYVKLITLLVAPVILISIVSSFISLGNKANMKSIGLESVAWLLIESALAILLSLAVGIASGIGGSASSVFAEIGAVSSGSVSAYSGLTRSFAEVVEGLFPSNLLGDLVENNVPGIILIALALAASYISVADEEGEDKVAAFRRAVEAMKKVVFRLMRFIVDLTPYAVLTLIAGSASNILAKRATLIQLLLLVAVIYAVCIVFTYIVGGILVRTQAKLNPVRFFKKIFPAQVTAFTTQASVGTLPVTISNLKDRVGVSEKVADFTAPLGTTIGMPGCTGVWPVLLAVFYVNATGLQWGIGEYAILGLVALFLSVGSAGVPGIAVVSAVALFNALGLPIGAVILLLPINTVSDMIRTLSNVSSAAIATAIVARKTDSLDDSVFNADN